MISELIRHFREKQGPRKNLATAENYLRRMRKNDSPENLEDWVRENLEEPVWAVRNIAVKLAGMGGVKSVIPELCRILTSDNEIGFIRRNSASTLIELEESSPEICESLVVALGDSYYEVRARAADALALLGDPDTALADHLIGFIFKKAPENIQILPIFFPRRVFREKNFEVRSALTRALGSLLTSEKQLHALEIILQDDHWKVRAAAIETYPAAAQRVGKSEDQIVEVLKSVDLTSQDFVPAFPIRRTLNQSITRNGIKGD